MNDTDVCVDITCMARYYLKVASNYLCGSVCLYVFIVVDVHILQFLVVLFKPERPPSPVARTVDAMLLFASNMETTFNGFLVFLCFLPKSKSLLVDLPAALLWFRYCCS